MKKIIALLLVVVFIAAGLGGVAYAQEDPPKDSIVIGASRPLTGPNAPIGDAGFGPIMALWQEEVNAAGGIYVAEYGASLPVEYIIYDDATDIGTMMALTEQLIVEDQVDILFSACGTAFIDAQAPIANEYGYVLITAEGGSTGTRDMLPELPYVFVTLAFSDHYQLPVFADMCAAAGAETAYMITIADSHGVEYGGVAAMEFDRVGIEVLANVSVPITYTNFPLLVNDAKAANPDVFCVFAYPPIVLPVTGEMMAQGFNPPAVIMGPGANFGFYGVSFGGDPAVVEGVSCFAAANSNTSPEFAELFADLEALVGWPNLDWWGAPYYAALVQIWQQSIEATGTLDQDVLRDYIATSTFDTILGPTWFEMFGDGGGLLAKEAHPGEIGQWQGGTVEIVGGGDWPNTVLTADFIYPKPDWPPPPGIDFIEIDLMKILFDRSPNCDKIEIKARFQLAEGASYNLDEDTVIVTIGDVVITIPPGSFVGSAGNYEFKSDGEPKVSMTLNFNKGEWSLKIGHIDASAIDSSDGVPVVDVNVTLMIGYMLARQNVPTWCNDLVYP